MKTKKIKIVRWTLFTDFGPSAIPYIFNQPKNISEEEIALGIQKQIYGKFKTNHTPDGGKAGEDSFRPLI